MSGKKGRDERIRELLSQGHEWSEQLEGETDRGAAVLAMAFIEGLLDEAIRSVLVNDSRVRKSVRLGGFEAKAIWARALGIISQDVQDELDRLRKIRNVFAHGLHNQSFDRSGSRVRTWCKELRLPAGWARVRQESEVTSPRDRFIAAAVLVAKYLDIRRKYLRAAPSLTGFRTTSDSISD